MKTFHFRQGTGPVLVSIPHGGTSLTENVAARLNDEGRLMRDTDWHLGKLYGFLTDMDVSLIEATMSRIVIDLNRPPDARSLYPGAHETTLCPLTTFDGAKIYQPGEAPDIQEITRRKRLYWDAYHQTLKAELERIKSEHGFVVLMDVHSIRSRIPALFQGTLPNLNIGTYGGRSCAPELTDLVMKCLTGFPQYSCVLNGRFKGGYITRQYGAPERGVHALQLELSQACYMASDPPFIYDVDKAAELSFVLSDFIKILLSFNPGIRLG